MDTVVEITRKNGVATVKFLSGDALRVPSALFLERRLRVGEAVDPEAYRAFLEKREDAFALETAMKYLALRERSVQEVRDRLRRACYGEACVERVLSALCDHHLISDARFAEAWAHSRARKYGRGRIAQELRVKGVGQAEARAALDAIPEEEEYHRAVEQAARLCRKFRGDPKKITQSLMRKGYGFGVARRAAEEAAQQRQAD